MLILVVIVVIITTVDVIVVVIAVVVLMVVMVAFNTDSSGRNGSHKRSGSDLMHSRMKRVMIIIVIVGVVSVIGIGRRHRLDANIEERVRKRGNCRGSIDSSDLP